MKILMRLMLVLGAGIGIVCLLQLYAAHRQGQPSGFNRTLIAGVLSNATSADLGASTLYLVDTDSAGFTVADYHKSWVTYSLEYNLKKGDTMPLDLPTSSHFAWGAAKILGFGQKKILSEGITPNLFLFDQTGSYSIIPGVEGMPTFDLMVPGQDGFAFRTKDTAASRYVMGTIVPGEKVKVNKDMLTPQQDGIFSLDGSLLYDVQSHRYVYVYYYRNGLIGFDQSLDSIYTGTTIDTVSRAQFTLNRIASEKKITFSSPPLWVNKHACTSDGMLFIYSGRRADNEKGKLAYTSSVIDVYAVSNFHYLGSFYVPNYDGEGLRDFKIYKSHLIALRGRKVFVFTFNKDTLLKD